MSLILAEVSHNDGFFVADTLLTPGFEDLSKGIGPFNGKFHALKVHILSKSLCIALAGDFGLGLSLINEVFTYVEKNKEAINYELFQVIFSLYQQICNDFNRPLDSCEFLVMLNIPSGNMLAKITNSGFKCFEKKHIGNHDAYLQLQSLRRSYNSPDYSIIPHSDGRFERIPFRISELEKNFIEISDAMERVSNQTKDADVAILGNSVIQVRITRSGNFEYMQQAIRGISFEEGNIGISLLSSVKPKHGIGIFYETGGFGDLFIAGDATYCRRIKAKTLDTFKKIAHQDYQLILDGATW